MDKTSTVTTPKVSLSAADFNQMKSREDLIRIAREKGFPIEKHIARQNYEQENYKQNS